MPTNLDNLSAGERHHLRYWTAFCEYMAQHSSFRFRLEFNPEKPKFWVQFPKELFGSNQIRLGAHNYPLKKYISVVLHLSGPKAKQRYDSLCGEWGQIEKVIGAGLNWQKKPGVRKQRNNTHP